MVLASYLVRIVAITVLLKEEPFPLISDTFIYLFNVFQCANTARVLILQEIWQGDL